MISIRIQVLFLFFAAVFSSLSLAMTRFEQEQISFTLHEEGRPAISCTHRPLKSVTPVPPPPWWTVVCGDREYTVDLWMSRIRLPENRLKISLMFHAKEGANSSGEKLAQFQNHFTQLVVKGETPILEASTVLDVRNGLASLEAMVEIDNP
ncbi:MAG: hypothetical protein HRT45_02210 [Bdellovibrionales bacterium]|nr:hypothetical protein [Bdellovibrionales bacterium]